MIATWYSNTRTLKDGGFIAIESIPEYHGTAMVCIQLVVRIEHVEQSEPKLYRFKRECWSTVCRRLFIYAAEVFENASWLGWRTQDLSNLRMLEHDYCLHSMCQSNYVIPAHRYSSGHSRNTAELNIAQADWSAVLMITTYHAIRSSTNMYISSTSWTE